MDKKLILFVDDDLNPKKEVSEEVMDILIEMEKTAEECGTVIMAYSLNSALSIIKDEETKVDSAVVDIYIPLEDDPKKKEEKQYGLQLIKELTAQHIHVVVITNRATRDECAKIGKEYGALVFEKDPSKENLEELKRAILDQPELKKRSRNCPFNKHETYCLEVFQFKGPESVFVISSEGNKEIARQVKKDLRDRRYKVDFWAENDDESGERIFCDKTCPCLYGNKIIAAEISDFNPNVFFEIGFAYGLGRLVLLVRKKENYHRELKLLRTVIRIEYDAINDIPDRFEKTVANRKKELQSSAVYETPILFKKIPHYSDPAKREKKGKYLVSYDNDLLINCTDILNKRGISSVIELNLSLEDHDIIPIVETLISAEAIMFLPQDDLEKASGEFRVNNAEITFLAGLCAAQGIPVRIITDGYSPDFYELILKPGNRNKIVEFMR